MEKTVYFRSFEEEDAEFIYKWMNDDDLKRMSIGVNRRMCRDEVLDWVRNRMRDNRSQIFWAICSIKDNRIIGFTCLTDIHYINRSACLGGMIIDKEYQDGFAWIEAHQFVFECVFERLGLNRIYGESLVGHKQSNLMESVMYFTKEGIKREAYFKNGMFYDSSCVGLLQKEYYEHKNAGDYETKSIIKRIAKLNKSNKNN